MKKIRLLISCALSVSALFCNSVTQGQTITTVAGYTPPPGPPPGPTEGVAATASTLRTPYGMAKDASGNLYICDDGNNMVRKVDASGNITVVAGNPGAAGDAGDGGPATAAACKLNTPTGVAVDSAGNIYICDAGNNQVRMVIAATGIITTIAGSTVGTAGFSGDLGPATAAKLSNPRGIFVYPNGKLIYFSDGTNNRIRAIANIFGGYYINTIAGNTAAGYAGDGSAATSATVQLSSPRGLTVNRATGNLYIADMNNDCIRMIDSMTGIITTVAGIGTMAGYTADGVPAITSKLNLPTGIAVDASGDMYIADVSNNRIRYVNSTGTISTIVDATGTTGATPFGDGGPATAANLSAPTAVTLDGTSGNYYISDQTHNLVRYVSISSSTPPSFTGGSPQTLTVCENSGATSINSLLQVGETTTGLTLTWSTATGPTHGTLAVAYSTTSTGSAITPTGLTYTPNTGYSGVDNFIVQVSNGASTATTTINVTVNPLPAVASIGGTTTSVCVGATMTLTDATTGGGWAAANTNASVAGGTVTGSAAGADVIYYIASNSCGADSAFLPITINPTAAPSVSISSTLGTSTCGVAGTFTAMPVNGGTAPAYQWSVNGTAVVGATLPSYTYIPVAGDVVKVVLTSNAPCITVTTASASITMSGGSSVVPTINISTGIGDTLCVGVPITLTSSITNGGSAPTYNWTVNGVSSGTGNTFPYVTTPLSEGDVIVCTLTSSIPCAIPSTVTSSNITIHLRTASTATLNITASPGSAVCIGTSITFTSTETGGGSDPFLRWSRAGRNVATGPYYICTPDSGDVVYCTMHSSIACSPTDSVNSNVITMSVSVPLTPVVTITSTRSLTGLFQPVTFIATVTSGTPTPVYQWYVNGVAVPGAASSIFVYSANLIGHDVISCTVGSGDGCNMSGFSNDLTIEVAPVGVRLLTSSATALKLVPNPNKGVFNMTLVSDNNEQADVVITNILGEKVKEFNIATNNTAEIKLDQAPGIYILSATTSEGTVEAKVMIN